MPALCQLHDKLTETCILFLYSIKKHHMKLKLLLVTIIATAMSFAAYAQDATGIRKKHFNTDDGIALHGYDPVAYFKQGKAVKGKKEIGAVVFEGVNYLFSSAENKEAFKKTPAAYEPQYGGWCAYAMGNDGSKVDIDPETFKIVNGKLYVFYNRFFNNTLKSWNKDESNLNKKADANWQKTFH
jgi:YHS domain-containing protein